MNTFIKRSMMLGVSLVFIGVSVVPACAQKKIPTKAIKAALGKKPPMTGTAPVVKPVTPRVPPTLQGAAVPNFTASVNKALDNAVERVVVPQTIRTIIKDTTPELTATNSAINFQNLITPYTPAYVPVGVSWKKLDREIWNFVYDWETTIKPTAKTKKAQREEAKLIARAKEEVRSICRNTDDMIFTKEDWELPAFIDVTALKDFRLFSYEGALLRNVHSNNHYVEAIILRDPTIRNFAAMRNKQIADALKAANNTAAPQFKAIPQADVTTQRTAEEIKSLVENLDPENPLRQAIEGTLKENGYIAPAE